MVLFQAMIFAPSNTQKGMRLNRASQAFTRNPKLASTSRNGLLAARNTGRKRSASTMFVAGPAALISPLCRWLTNPLITTAPGAAITIPLNAITTLSRSMLMLALNSADLL